MKKQIVVIHGGDAFENYEMYMDFLRNFEIDIERYKSDKKDWKPRLRTVLGNDYEVITPIMPNKTNAQFSEWKLWFEKVLSLLNEEVILIGHSLGGSFLAKYLSENRIQKKIKAVFLVAAVFDKDLEGYSLASFTLPQKLNLQTSSVFLYHSKDDPVVGIENLHKLQKQFPTAVVRELDDKGHINHEEFSELFDDIKSLG